MEHIQHLTTTWLRPPKARADTREPEAPPELPDRERIRRLAEVFHKQLVQARQRNGTHYDVLRAQTEALRQFTVELTPAQADTFMNMYTEESSAVEREWMSRQSGRRIEQPLDPMFLTMLTFAVSVLAIGLALYYVM
jgi:hypothetical protein